MAEKEERIYVRQYGEDNPCDTCEDKNGDGCDFCMKNYEWNASIPRKEAIERMAKAISKAFLDDKGNPQGATDKELAEAALNALLEADK